MVRRKLLAVVFVILGVIGGGTFVYFAVDSMKQPKSAENSTQSFRPEEPTVNAACSLVKKSDIESVFGVEFKDGTPERRASSSGSACKFEQKTDGSVAGLLSAITFSIKVDPFENTAAAEKSLKTTKSADKSGDKVMFVMTNVPDIGDEAFFFQGQAPGIFKTQEYMYVRKGNTIVHFVAIKLDGINHEQSRSDLIKIAKKALN